MKKHILGIAAVAAIIVSLNTGCSSEKAASGSDSTKVDSTSGTKPITTDSAGRDTARRDTSRTNPPTR